MGRSVLPVIIIITMLVESSLPRVIQVQAQFSQVYDRLLNNNETFVFMYAYTETNMTTAIRIDSSSSDANDTSPALFVVKQHTGVLSWQIPLEINYKKIHRYNSVSRTPCPLDGKTRSIVKKNQEMFIDVSSLSDANIKFSISASIVDNFYISTNTMMDATISPSTPVYYVYKFPEDVQSVIVIVTSEDDYCMVVSIQDIKCPVFDLEDDVDFQGKYQTMTKQAAIHLEKDDYKQSGFYLVMVVKSNDAVCNTPAVDDSTNRLDRYKNVTIEVQMTRNALKYGVVIGVTLAIFFVFWLVLAVFIWSYKIGRAGDSTTRTVKTEVYVPQPQSIDESSPVAPATTIGTDEIELSQMQSTDKSSQVAPALPRRYFWNVLTIGIFYGLPVAQLVLNYQKTITKTGDQDICYYNFLCAHPLGWFTSFNNVFSNIGYIILGLLFIVIIKVRACQTNGAKPHGKDLFYAMGLALIMEGVMSGCYHVCPKNSNFQFDTSFMYIISCLTILKVYQIPNPDVNRSINRNAYMAYLYTAFIIFFAFIGVVYNTSAVWIVFALVHIFVSLIISLMVYYKIDCGHACFKVPQSCRDGGPDLSCKEIWCKEGTFGLGFLVIGFVINLFLAIAGAIWQSDDFATFLLGIYIINLGILLITHLIKTCCDGQWTVWIWISLVITIALWVVAIHYFVANLTSWAVAPAVSREGNRECIVADFYDAHDIWHFLSGVALFMSFVTILLSDEIRN